MTDNQKTVNTKLFLSILKNADAESLAKVVSKKKKSNKGTEENATVKTVGETASKIVPLEENNEMHELLAKIYGFLKTSNENKLKLKEKENNFKEENEAERNKQHKDLIDALNKMKFGDTATKMVEQDTNMNFFDIVTSILGAFGAGKAALGLLTRIGTFFLTGAGATLLLGAAPFAAMLALTNFLAPTDKGGNTKEQTELLNNILKETNFKPTTTDVVPEEDMSGRPMFRTSAYDARKKRIQNSFDLGTEYSPEDAVRIKKAYGIDVPKENIATTTKVQETNTPSVPTQEQSQNNTQSVTPNETQSNTIPSSESLSPGESIVIPESNPTESERLNSAIKENVVAKLEESLSAGETVVVNNSTSSSSMASGSVDKPFLPAVRNLEPTFQKMILDSTRIV